MSYRFKPGTLACRMRKNPDGDGPALVYSYDRKPNGGWLAMVFESIDSGYGRTFAEELEARGYDLSTLQFTIRRKQ